MYFSISCLTHSLVMPALSPMACKVLPSRYRPRRIDASRSSAAVDSRLSKSTGRSLFLMNSQSKFRSVMRMEISEGNQRNSAWKKTNVREQAVLKRETRREMVQRTNVFDQNVEIVVLRFICIHGFLVSMLESILTYVSFPP